MKKYTITGIKKIPEKIIFSVGIVSLSIPINSPKIVNKNLLNKLDVGKTIWIEGNNSDEELCLASFDSVKYLYLQRDAFGKR